MARTFFFKWSCLPGGSGEEMDLASVCLCSLCYPQVWDTWVLLPLNHELTLRAPAHRELLWAPTSLSVVICVQ